MCRWSAKSRVRGAIEIRSAVEAQVTTLAVEAAAVEPLWAPGLSSGELLGQVREVVAAICHGVMRDPTAVLPADCSTKLSVT